VGARAGFTTVEGIVAIALLSLAALGAAGTMARSARTLGAGNRDLAAARATEQAIEHLGAHLRAAGRLCTAVGSGTSRSAAAVVSWTPVVAAGGLDLIFVTAQFGPQQHRSDTLWLFMPCN
jgi:type II secretory pathway component PulJ